MNGENNRSFGLCLYLNIFSIRKLILFLFFINIHTLAYSQVIKGRIFDKQTNEVVMFATVYFNGTFVGTCSNEQGRFELDISKNKSMPLTISAVGYYSTTLNNFSPKEISNIYLMPKLFDLKEVEVSDKSLVRKRKANLKLFKDEFLGTTTNANQCEIINENDISFDYQADIDTLKAFASKPIIIHNQALGYKITYYLDKFEYYKKSESVYFYGNIIFNEDIISDETQKEYYERKRSFAYQGSRMHFFRMLWTDNLKKTEFIIKNSQRTVLKYKNIVVQEANDIKFLSYEKYIEIGFNTSLSYIIFRKRQVYFDKNGYFDPSGIIWKGEMGNQRIADWLPYEYYIE